MRAVAVSLVLLALLAGAQAGKYQAPQSDYFKQISSDYSAQRPATRHEACPSAPGTAGYPAGYCTIRRQDSQAAPAAAFGVYYLAILSSRGAFVAGQAQQAHLRSQQHHSAAGSWQEYYTKQLHFTAIVVSSAAAMQ
jgi:hypothetical protein